MAAMSVSTLSDQAGMVVSDHPDVEIVVPVYNEEAQLEQSIEVLCDYLDTAFPFTACITIADNASTDGTWQKALGLARSRTGVRAIHLEEKGRGRALRAAWSASAATVVAYLDVDLSTGLDALLPLVAPLLSGHSDVAIGTRLAPGARVVRGPMRELISRGYNVLIRLSLHGRFSDAQCGFKALRRQVAATLVPLVQDDGWFFDTELLVLAQRLALRIHEVPVDWVEDPDSRVDVARTIRDDLRGLWRMLRHAPHATEASQDQATSAELLDFAGVGAVSILAPGALFVLSWPLVGSFGANSLAIASWWLLQVLGWRPLTGRAKAMASPSKRRLGGSGALVAVSLLTMTGALGLASLLAPTSLPLALLALSMASALAALARFILLRSWLFRPHLGTGPRPCMAPTFEQPEQVDPMVSERFAQGA